MAGVAQRFEQEWGIAGVPEHKCWGSGPPPPIQCYLGYAYACSNRPPLFSKSPVCKVNTARPFSFVYEPFSGPPLFSKSPVCKVNTARPFSFVTKRTFWQHACGHFET